MNVNNRDDNEQLRSEKVRNLLGEIPSSLTVCGIVVIVLIIVALLGVVCFVPYPYSDGESILSYVLSSRSN